MNADFFTLASTNVAEPTTVIPCALRLHAPESNARIPTHFVLCIDVSESMVSDSKLENVKKCCSLVVNLLNDQDRISLITFGDDANLHLKRVAVDEGNKNVIRSTIQNLAVDGCTNLSAGLMKIDEVCEGDTQKAGLLLLTDGHANRGASSPQNLRNLMTRLRERFAHLSVHCIAYGADHNAELLRLMAEDCQGSYNIVNNIEDTAFAFGDTLGGLMSCAFQNVEIDLGRGAVVHGPLRKRTVGDRTFVALGDVYSGTKPLVLFDLPADVATGADAVVVRGIALPDAERFELHPIRQEMLQKDRDIELTRLRYQCTSILNDLRDMRGRPAAAHDILERRINEFAIAVADEFFAGQPVAQLLRDEVNMMRNLLAQNRAGHVEAEAAAYTSQRIASIGLARGFSSPQGAMRSASAGGGGGAPLRHHRTGFRFAAGAAGAPGGILTQQEDEDPTTVGFAAVGARALFTGVNDTEEEVTASASATTPSTATVFQNNMQAQISALLASASVAEDANQTV
jgi:Mg-chelatase subunit ChlD